MFDAPLISHLPLSDSFTRKRVEAFLAQAGLRLEVEGEYMALCDDESGEILAGGGLEGDIIKCVAVREDIRSGGLMGRVITELIALAARRGHASLKVFTKPEYRSQFESMGFHLLASAPQAVLLENGSGLEKYLKDLRSAAASHGPGKVGVIVMNANPFTLGHRYLIHQAAERVEHLFLIPVKEDKSLFSYAERKAMIEAGSADLDNVTVLDGSAYSISAATFPTYFLKDLSQAAETQMRLDIDLFCKHIAPALLGEAAGIARFAGSEDGDPLTARYNSIMAELLPKYGLDFVEIERLKDEQGRAFRASEVRTAMDQGRFGDALSMTPAASAPWILARAASYALRTELYLDPKPGLVSPQSRGAHDDMDAALMEQSISAIQAYFARMALCADDAGAVRHAGIEAEQAMLSATGGINTHRGAIFCLGLSVAAIGRFLQSPGTEELKPTPLCNMTQGETANKLSVNILRKTLQELAMAIPQSEESHGAHAVQRYGAKGALQMAREGYAELFGSWLPYLKAHRGDPFALHKTLLLIISELDDTCILHRSGPARAERVRQEACDLLGDFSIGAMREMDVQLSSEGISPGGAADMLALTIFFDSLSADSGQIDNLSADSGQLASAGLGLRENYPFGEVGLDRPASLPSSASAPHAGEAAHTSEPFPEGISYLERISDSKQGFLPHAGEAAHTSEPFPKGGIFFGERV